MKIVEHGMLPEQRPLWPLLRQFSCFHCRCQFIVEEGDAIEVEQVPSYDQLSRFQMNCPECATSLTFLKMGRPFYPWGNVPDGASFPVIAE